MSGGCDLAVPSSRLVRGVFGGTQFESLLCDPWAFEEYGSVAGVAIMCGGLRSGVLGVGCHLAVLGST